MNSSRRRESAQFQLPVRSRKRRFLPSLGSGRGKVIRRSLTSSDCFAYAIAKNHRTTLLFKGEDFRKTDIRSAVPSPSR
jgi:uncharacterized protein with PIN domain